MSITTGIRLIYDISATNKLTSNRPTYFWLTVDGPQTDCLNKPDVIWFYQLGLVWTTSNNGKSLLIMWIGHLKEIRKLTFLALALRLRSTSTIDRSKLTRTNQWLLRNFTCLFTITIATNQFQEARRTTPYTKAKYSLNVLSLNSLLEH